MVSGKTSGREKIRERVEVVENGMQEPEVWVAGEGGL